MTDLWSQWDIVLGVLSDAQEIFHDDGRAHAALDCAHSLRTCAAAALARAERAEAYAADLGQRLDESEARKTATEGRRLELAQDYERLLDERAEERMAHISTEAALEARAERAEAAERDLQAAADMAAAYLDSIIAERDELQRCVVEAARQWRPLGDRPGTGWHLVYGPFSGFGIAAFSWRGEWENLPEEATHWQLLPPAPTEATP